MTDPPYGLGFMGKEWDDALPIIEGRIAAAERAVAVRDLAARREQT